MPFSLSTASSEFRNTRSSGFAATMSLTFVRYEAGRRGMRTEAFASVLECREGVVVSFVVSKSNILRENGGCKVSRF